MLVWCDLHVARNVLCTEISRAVVINTRDFTKKLGTSHKNTRVLHSRVSSLNRAVPYVHAHTVTKDFLFGEMTIIIIILTTLKCYTVNKLSP